MRRLIEILISIFGVLLIGGCGDVEDIKQPTISSIQKNLESSEEPIRVYALAELGNLANAKVDIFELESDGNLTLKWEEITSSGEKLEDIGRFNSHSMELKDDKFYLYRVSGGEDWDSNNDGKRDDSPIQNSGSIHLIAKGSDIIDTGENLRVTAVSQMLFQSVENEIKYRFRESNFNRILKEKSTSIVDSDKLDEALYSILSYNPVKDRKKLRELNRLFLDSFVSNIRKATNKKIDVEALGLIFGKSESNSSRAVSFSLNGEYGFLSTGDSGFKIFNMDKPSTPKLINSIDTSGYAFNVKLYSRESKEYLFVADGKDGLKIFDISKVEDGKERLISTIKTNSSTIDFVISKDTQKLFIADGSNGIKIFDISNLSIPKKIYQLKDGFGYVNAISLSRDEKTLFIADALNGVKIFDITTLEAPLLISKLDSSFITGFGISSDEKSLYLLSIDGVKIFDISDPQQPSFISMVSELEYPNGVAFSKNGSILYISELFKGVAKIDISDNNYPKKVGLIPLANSSMGLTIFRQQKDRASSSSKDNNGTQKLEYVEDDRDFLAVANGDSKLIMIDISETRFNGVE